MAGGIQLVVFDLGGVLIEVDHDSAIDWLLSRGCRVGALEEFVERTGLREHERGELSGDVFLARVNTLLAQPQPLEVLERWWGGFFHADESMLALARKLRAHYRVCILSNTGPLHWRQACEQFDMQSLVHDTLTSFVAGAAKPDPEIYAIAQQRFGCAPERTVFVDDLAENVAGAVSAGWHGIHHRGAQTTLTGLRDLGVATA